MKNENQVTTEDAQAVGERTKARGCIVLTFTEDDVAFACWGSSPSDSIDMGQLVEKVVDQIEAKTLPVWRG